MIQQIKNKLEEKLKVNISSFSSLSGGCISNAFKVKTSDNKNYLLKINESHKGDMFLKEAHGLVELKKTNAIKVPEVIMTGKDFILLEFINSSDRSKTFFKDFGIKFSGMHKYHSSTFGFYEDNYIGANAQPNIPAKDEEENWVKFYFNKRILYQYKLAEKNGYTTKELREGIAKLENKIEEILSGSEESPSLLHGDLWSGNYMVDDNGDACLIDPAVYYGHREADLGMTKLFGGFSSDFYNSYNENYPLPDGYDYRENIYKLYHVLNHLNLFGRGYYTQSISLINYYL
ncbi:MAG: fructosamine kinase family protein [Ignavibacteriaceae bacterium]